MNFRIAMQARRAISSLCRPHEIIDQSYDFLIVERRYGRDEQLLLAEAGPCGAHVRQAPAGLKPRQVMIATLVSRGPEAGSETFLLDRHIPRRAQFSGMFLPADGFLRLSVTDRGVTLRGACKLTWAAQQKSDFASQAIARALSDAPEPVGCVLHVDATQIPWTREVLPHPSVQQQKEGDCP